MIKLRDDVYFRELEEFGFKYSFKEGTSYDFIYKPKKDSDIPLITIDRESKILDIKGVCDNYNTVEDTLYDLYEANLVEKVSNNQSKEGGFK